MGAKVGAPIPAKLTPCALPLPGTPADGVSIAATSTLCWRIAAPRCRRQNDR